MNSITARRRKRFLNRDWEPEGNMVNSGALGLRDVAIGLLVASYRSKYLGRASLPIGLAALIAGKYNNSGLLSAIGLALAVSDAPNIFKSDDGKKEESNGPSQENKVKGEKESAVGERQSGTEDGTENDSSEGKESVQGFGTGENVPDAEGQETGQGTGLEGDGSEGKSDGDKSFEEVLDDLEEEITTTPEVDNWNAHARHFYSEEKKASTRRHKVSNDRERPSIPEYENVKRKEVREEPELFEDRLVEMLV